MNLTVPEIIILQSGAIVLGFVIHHFFINKKNKNPQPGISAEQQANSILDMKFQMAAEADMKEREIKKLAELLKDAEENLKIYEIEIEERSKELKKLRNQGHASAAEISASGNEMVQLKQQLTEALEDNKILQIEVQERIKEVKKLKSEIAAQPAVKAPVMDEEEFNEVKKKLAEAQEDNNILNIETGELRKQIKELKAVLEKTSTTPAVPATTAGSNYYDQLQMAQQSLRQENERIGRLLEQIEVIREKEEKEREILSENEALSQELSKLKQLLNEKETEINSIQQKANLTREMTSMLDNAYSEFNVLQDKMHKLEVQVTASRMTSMELEDLKEAHYRLTKDYEEQKLKLSSATNEKQQYFRELTESEEKLKEANFQRQQLQKKVAYLEELTRDLNTMAAANKKLEGQIRRIGELESMLNIAEEEKEELKKKMTKPP